MPRQVSYVSCCRARWFVVVKCPKLRFPKIMVAHGSPKSSNWNPCWLAISHFKKPPETSFEKGPVLRQSERNRFLICASAWCVTVAVRNKLGKIIAGSWAWTKGATFPMVSLWETDCHTVYHHKNYSLPWLRVISPLQWGWPLHESIYAYLYYNQPLLRKIEVLIIEWQSSPSGTLT